MPLPTIANVFQSVLNWHNASAPRDAANILHWKDSAGGQTEANLFADFSASVSAIQWQAVTSNGIINAMRITKLDGVSAGQTFPIVAAAKWTGGGGADCVLQGSQVISLKSSQRGPRGRNRVYLPWVAEDRQVNGTIDATVTTNVLNAWGTFLVAMSAAGWDLHAVSAAHSDSHIVTNVSVSQSMFTQRRRARR